MKRLVAFSMLPVALAAAVLGVGGVQRASAAAAAPEASPTCILGILCLPSGSPSSSASPTTGSPSPTSASPSPTTSTSTGPGPSPSAGPTPSATPSGSASPGGSAGPTPSATGSKKPASRKHAAVRRVAASPGLVLSDATTVLSAGSATFTNFVFAGNVNMPVAGGGTVAMMKFTADTITLSGDVRFSITQDGESVVQTGDTFAFSGGVTFYATKLSGSVLGLPLTFTPSTADAVFLSLLANPVTATVIPSLTLTNTSADQALSVAGSVRYIPLSVGFGG